MSRDSAGSPSGRIPDEDDWHSEGWDLDIPYAYEHFQGKDVAEATRLFAQCSLTYQEDLMWMPSRCFTYYIHAYLEYLLSAESAQDSDGASCFFALIGHKLEFTPRDIVPIWPAIASILTRLSENQAFYDASPDIYGDFPTRANALFSQFAALNREF